MAKDFMENGVVVLQRYFEVWNHRNTEDLSALFCTEEICYQNKQRMEEVLGADPNLKAKVQVIALTSSSEAEVQWQLQSEDFTIPVKSKITFNGGKIEKMQCHFQEGSFEKFFGL